MKELDNCWKRTNLNKVGQYCEVKWKKLDNSTQQALKEAGYADNIFAGMIDLPQTWVDGHQIPDEAVIDYMSWVDDDEIIDTMNLLLKEADNYLVFSTKCRWLGTSGYKITNYVADALLREYDVAIYPLAVSHGKKTLQCIEFSHDVPTGANTYIIALTDKEYEQLGHADFRKVQNFVEKCIGNAA